MKLFSKFGVEATFYPKLKLPKWIYGLDDQGYGMWGRVYEQYYSTLNFDETQSDDSNFVRYNDDGCLEVTTQAPYEDYYLFKKHYNFIVSQMAKKKIYPSSQIYMECEGGCHLNFDLSELREKYGEAFVVRFLNNYRNFVLTHPSIAWTFLSPHDNQSSVLVYKDDVMRYGKGEFFTVRREKSEEEKGETQPSNALTQPVVEEVQSPPTSLSIPVILDYVIEMMPIEYMELRHFMMPRNDREFDVHFEFANTLLNHILLRTQMDNDISFFNSEIKSYTFTVARDQIARVCKKICFDFNKIKDVGKLELLKERFTFGSDYLV